MEITITVSIIGIVSAFLLCFIKIIRFPATFITLPLVVNNILMKFVNNMDPKIGLLIGLLVSLVLLILSLIKNKNTFERNSWLPKFLYGFCLLYFTFAQLVSVVDAFSALFNNNYTFINKLLTNELAVDSLVLQFVVSLIGGVIFCFTNEVTATPLRSFLGCFMIVLFTIDIFSGNRNFALTFSSDNFVGIIELLEKIELKNIEIYSKTANDFDYIHIYIAFAYATIISIVTTIFKKRQEFIF